MSLKVKPLSLQLVDTLQVILGTMELGDLKAALVACQRARDITDQLKAEIVNVIADRHKEELAAVKAAMPGKQFK